MSEEIKDVAYNINADNVVNNVVETATEDNASDAGALDSINADSINADAVAVDTEEGTNEEEDTTSTTELDGKDKSTAEEPVRSNKPSRRELKEEVKQENLQALRESRKQLQQERDLYMQRVQALEAAQGINANKPVIDDDDDYDPTQKEIKQMKLHIAELGVNNSRMKLQTQYPDFKAVVNDESIAILKQRFPEVASTLDQSTDLYTTGVSAYNIIKKFGLNVNEDSVDNARVNNTVQRQKVASNVAKPRPVSSIKSGSALTHANDYSDLSDKSVRDEIIRLATERASNA